MTGMKSNYDPDAAALSDYTQQIQDMELDSFDPEEPEGLDEIGESFKSLMAPSASMGRNIMMLGAPAAIAQDSYMASFATPETEALLKQHGIEQEGPFNPTATQDAYFREVVDEIGTSAVESWRPNVDAMGASAKALSTVNSVVGSIPSMVGMPALFLSNSGVDPATELVRQGVDSHTAMGVGAVNLAVNAVGMRLPASFGTTLPTRLATGAGGNLAIGVGGDVASSTALELGGYEQAAEGFDAANPYARGLDILMGLAFGAKAHIDAPRLVPSQRDAVLVAMNADHYQRTTMPGEAITPGGDIRHQDGLDLAMDQVLNGEPVDVGTKIRAEDFTLRPELRALLDRAPSESLEAGAPSAASYAAYRHALESGGKSDARPIDPKTGRRMSEAYGTDQFIPTTWRTVVAKAKPSWAEGLTDAQLLEARSDPAKSAEMVAVLDAGHTSSLQAAGLPVNRHTLYAAHHFGINKGKAFARAGDPTRMELILTEGQLKANPYLRGKTKAEAIANWDERARGAGVDLSQFEGSAAPRPSAALEPVGTPRPRETAPTAEPGRPTVDLLRSGESLFPEPPPRASLDEYAAWMEGRERSAVAAERVAVQGVLDGSVPVSQAQLPKAQQMSPDQAKARLAELDQRERDIPSRFAPADPAVRQSFDEYATRQRNEGQERIVERDDQAGTANDGAGIDDRQIGADATAGPAGRARTGVDATDRGVEGNDAVGRAVEAASPARAGIDGNVVDGRGRDNAQRPGDSAAGADASQANGRADPTGRGGRDSPATLALQPLATADAVAQLDPNLRVPTGELDSDGNPVSISASEYLAAAKAEAQQADVEVRAIHAAANCFLRSAA